MGDKRGHERVMIAVAKRPVLYSALFGLNLGTFSLLMGVSVPVAILVAVAFAILIYVLYRPGGIGQRWVEDISEQ